MAERSLPTPDQLRQLLDYCPASGRLVWRCRGPEWFSEPARGTVEGRCRAWNSKHAGKEAFGHRNSKGYRYAKLLGQLVMGHRVAFAVHHGRWPKGEIDHINGDRSDNSIANLREADRTLNNRNRRHARGYHCDPARSKPWRAYIGEGGRRVSLGSFSTEAEAAHARREAERSYGYPA